nr:hypothetical protein [uncultured Mediterranean phage uvMED]
MPTKELLVDIGNYLKGNYDMGGAIGHQVDEVTKAVNTGSGGRTGQTDIKSQEIKGYEHNANEWEKIKTGETRPNENNAFAMFNKGVVHAVNETSNFLAGDPRGYNQKKAQEREAKAQAEAMANRVTGAFAQDDKKKKKKKGLLAMNTPSAKASRFRSGKRRFRVKPGSGTGVNVGGSSGSASVGTS